MTTRDRTAEAAWLKPFNGELLSVTLRKAAEARKAKEKGKGR